MVSRIAQWTFDVSDVDLMAEFWSSALGLVVDQGDDGAAKLYPPASADSVEPVIWLQPTARPKRAKNRGHPDLRPLDGDFDAEVRRLLDLGARHTDVGQSGGEDFVVLADPEGNEFCVLRSEP